ncbi:MAG: WD40 repeat domain-containing protein [Bacteroidetes bacterium]|nr:WD40 repeat domain-containing protein [Bacteroidota bacterium]
MKKLLVSIFVMVIWFGCEDSLIDPISGDDPTTIPDLYHNPVNWISFSADGNYLITTSPEDQNFWSALLVRKVPSFDTSDFQIPDTLISNGSIVVHSAIITKNFETNKKYFIVGSNGGANLYEYKTTGGAKLFTRISITGNVTQLAIYNDSLLACGSSTGIIKIWNLVSNNLIKTISAHSGEITGLAITENGKSIISSSLDNSIVIWRISDGKPLHTMYHNNSVTGISISPDEKYLVSVGLDKNINIWNPINGDWYRTIKDNDWINAVVFSPDKKTIATGGDDNIVKLWDVSTGKKYNNGEITNHTNRILALAYSIDGKYLASSAADKKLVITKMK